MFLLMHSQTLTVPHPGVEPGCGPALMLRSGQQRFVTQTDRLRHSRHDLTGIHLAGVSGQILVQQRKALACEGRQAARNRMICYSDRLRRGRCQGAGGRVHMLLEQRKALACQGGRDLQRTSADDLQGRSSAAPSGSRPPWWQQDDDPSRCGEWWCDDVVVVTAVGRGSVTVMVCGEAVETAPVEGSFALAVSVSVATGWPPPR